MKQLKTLSVLLMALGLLAGCGAQESAPEAPEELEAQEERITLPAAPQVIENPLTEWLPEGTLGQYGETEHLPELAAVIAETYDIPEDAWADTRYYYNYVDLNNDGTEEIFAVAMGMYTSGSGGDSGLLVQPYAGMNVAQTFTLLRAPILVCDSETDGVHDLVYLRSGGGGGTDFVRLTCTDGVYTNPADAEALNGLEGISGTAILCNDVMADLEAGSALTLAG